jgi:hypothetical protein
MEAFVIGGLHGRVVDGADCVSLRMTQQFRGFANHVCEIRNPVREPPMIDGLTSLRARVALGIGRSMRQWAAPPEPMRRLQCREEVPNISAIPRSATEPLLNHCRREAETKRTPAEMLPCACPVT